MSLEIGTELGPYKITGLLGKGGMGEVYRAHDPRLHRDVAIKVSAERFSEQFEREARAIAALNHPSICQIYDVGPNFLVMELVEGESPRGPMDLDEALRIADQIADALQEAHDKHITHRDLKPGNIKITPDGKVKVLDFGLAKFGGNAPTAVRDDSPTISMAMTQAGVIVGTAAYMAPEQARGKPVDSRADIWAFGVVLYELLTGKRLFEGEDLTETLASVVKEQPRLDAVPTSVRRLLHACLQKDPKKRLQSVADMRLLLDVSSDVEAALQPRTRWLWPALAAIALAGMAALGVVHFREKPVEGVVMRLSVPLPEGTSALGHVALSPDGRRVMANFSRDGWNGLWVRALDGSDWTRLDSTRNARAPFWSPNSRFLGFFADGKLKTVPAAGGPAKELCGETGLGRGGAWNDNDIILFSGESGMRRVSASGGDCAAVTKGDRTLVAGYPTFLPDGKQFLYVGQIEGKPASRGVYVASLEDPVGIGLPGKKVLDDFSSVLYTAPAAAGQPSHLLFIRGTTLLAQAFDITRVETVGDPFPVIGEATFSFSVPQVAVSTASDGTLIYITNRSPYYQLTWIDRTGKRVMDVGMPSMQRRLSLSPDGRFATVARTNEGMWLHDLERNSESRFPGDINPGAGTWSRDSKELVYTSTVDGVRGVYRRAANGGSKEELLRADMGNPRLPSDWSQSYLIYTEVDPKTRGDIWYLPDPLNPESKAVRFLGSEAVESQGQLSPDGRWLAYYSDVSGRGEVYVRQFPSGQGFMKVSVNGGVEPRWKKDGTELYFLQPFEGDWQLTAVPLKAEGPGGLHLAQLIPLFRFGATNIVPEGNAWLYGPHPDGERFLVVRRNQTASPAIYVITNWQKSVTASPPKP